MSIIYQFLRISENRRTKSKHVSSGNGKILATFPAQQAAASSHKQTANEKQEMKYFGHLSLSHDIQFITSVPNFSSLAWSEVPQAPPPVLKVILGGRWRFLTGDLEDGVILDMLNHFGRPPETCPESFMKIWLHLAEILRCVTSMTKMWQTNTQTQLKFY